jgi:hypothetical protein
MKEWLHILPVSACLVLTSGALATSSQREKASEVETIWGGNMNVVVEESVAVRTVRGVVELAEQPTEDALVEIFDHPELVLNRASRDRTGQIRLAYHRTDRMGRFSFHLPDGDYEIRASKELGIDVTSVLIHVRKSAPVSRKPLVIPLKLGT